MIRIFLTLIFGAVFSQTFAQSYQLNGSAIATGSDCYQITAAIGNQVGTVWYTDLLDLNEPFEINFEMNFGNNDGGADGMVFGLQTVGPFAAGVGGGGIGFTGFMPSLGIEFDTWQNGEFGDIPSDHIAIMKNGSGTHSSPDNLAGPVQANATSVNIEDNTEHYIRITWDPAEDSLRVYFDCVFRVGIQNDIVNTIFGGQNNVYWGFTGSTGGAVNTQTVCLSENIFPVTYTFDLCPGESMELSPYILNGTNYSWAPATGLSATNIPNPIASPATDTQYIVTFLDACGQTKKDTVNINVIDSEPIITFNQNTFISCPDDIVDIEADVTNNFGTVTYSWSPVPGSTNELSVSPDVLTWYYLTATDECTSSIDSVKVEIGVIDLTDIDVVNATNCPGLPGTPGEIEVFPDDPDWEYTLTNGATVIGPQPSNEFVNLSGGVNYFLHVVDENGCAIDTIVYVGLGSNPVTATFVTDSIQHVSCFGADDGGAYVTNVQGGISPPYNITWTTTTGLFDQTNVGVGGSDDQDQLPGGNWVVTVTDDEGCAWSQVFVINEPGEITLDFISNEPNCYQFTDGSVTVNTTGGNGGNVFNISNAAGTQLNIANSNTVNQLGTGWYIATITDNNGCFTKDSIFLNQPGQLNVELDLIQPACYGDSTGFALADTVFNYTGDYQDIAYFWAPKPQGSNGIGNLFSAGLYQGEYTLTINDENGCSRTMYFDINYPPALVFTEFGYEPAYCRLYGYQSGNGVVYAAGSGGVPDYDYLWLNLQTGQTSNNTTWGGLNPGDYQMTMTDENGCTLVQTITVDSLNPLADFEMTSPEFTSNYEGTAVVNVHFVNQSLYFANPIDPLADTTFFWHFGYAGVPWQISHDVAETFDTSYYEGGTYDVCLVAINKNGCVDTLCKPVIVYDPLVFLPLNIFTPDGDGVNDLFSFNYRSEAVAEFHCVIVNRWGVVMFEMDDVTDAWDGKDKNGSTRRNGVYFYTYEGAAENGAGFKGQGNIELIGKEK
jgi:gliding motility-associated-like protein